MKEPPNTESIRWRRVVGVIVLAFLIAEGLARVAIYVWSGQAYRSMSPYLWSPYGLVRNNPKWTSPEYAINKNGFRDLRDYGQAKPANTLRVILLGGSTLYSGLQGNVFDVVPNTRRVDSGSTIAQFLHEKLVADPELAGLNIEVINAAVNFNRIVEVSAAYLAEYSHWDPDFVIVAGSANNFSGIMPKGSILRRDFVILNSHPWKSEFERMVNRNDLLSTLDNAIRAFGDHSAAGALGVKLLSKTIDATFGRAGVLAGRWGFAPSAKKGPPAADWKEYDQYIDEYLGYASAMVAVARHRHQEISFFWEHFIAQVGGMKPLTDDERKLYRANHTASSEQDAEFTFHARDRVAAFCSRNDVQFVDPIERLKSHPGSVFIDYLHYTAEGNRFMAGYIYDIQREAFLRRAAEIRLAEKSR